jgi:hypothetical protein
MPRQEPPNNPELLKELTELMNLLLITKSTYDLNAGKWDPKQVLEFLELRERALAKTIQAVRAGHNRGTVVESLLSFFGIDPYWPNFW